MRITVSRKKHWNILKLLQLLAFKIFSVHRVVETIVLFYSFCRCTCFIPVYSDCLMTSKCISWLHLDRLKNKAGHHPVQPAKTAPAPFLFFKFYKLGKTFKSSKSTHFLSEERQWVDLLDLIFEERRGVFYPLPRGSVPQLSYNIPWLPVLITPPPVAHRVCSTVFNVAFTVPSWSMTHFTRHDTRGLPRPDPARPELETLSYQMLENKGKKDHHYCLYVALSPVHTVAEKCDCTVAQKWDCHTKVRLSQKSATIEDNSETTATVALFCDSVDRLLCLYVSVFYRSLFIVYSKLVFLFNSISCLKMIASTSSFWLCIFL